MPTQKPTDHFSQQASLYKDFRPHYPDALFQFLAEQSPERQTVCDIATGNGQAIGQLQPLFERVVAFDLSLSQLQQAQTHPQVLFGQALSEALPLQTQSLDLITAAQALHWFDHPRFYAEVRRVLKPGGVIAAWTYKLLNIAPEIDQLIQHFHGTIVGPWWPKERQLVENGYKDIPFPFEPIAAPAFTMTAQWNYSQLLGYLGTWSAVQRYKNDKGTDPVLQIADQLRECWGDISQPQQVSWPLPLLVGKVT